VRKNAVSLRVRERAEKRGCPTRESLVSGEEASVGACSCATPCTLWKQACHTESTSQLASHPMCGTAGRRRLATDEGRFCFSPPGWRAKGSAGARETQVPRCSGSLVFWALLFTARGCVRARSWVSTFFLLFPRLLSLCGCASVKKDSSLSLYFVGPQAAPFPSLSWFPVGVGFFHNPFR
jgi:hypothetical protein